MDTKLIGGKIAKARKEKNMSQAQLAQLLFISQQAVGKWERGESIPDIVTLNRLAEIFGVDLNYFSENFPSTADETAVKMSVAIDSNIEQAAQEEVASLPGSERQLLTDFSASNLAESDFAGVTAHKSKFDASTLLGSDFSGADLTGSSFKVGNARGANFDGANLTDCNFSILDLVDASFNKTILVRTEFNKTELTRAKFTNVTLIDVKLIMIDLRNTVFEKCTFSGVDFKYCDLRGTCLDGLTFTGVRFDKAALNEATFKGTTLRNVSFIPTFALTNKYYRAIKTICFDGAKMDKLTYAALKGIGADLSKVTII
ncbi:pentapeptide repeat-containing protein [Chitinophaga barathri]|uniref:Helix-turn-helix domain-containing protein n=1 Tax=Chitinophaga barathri TaxID=1647451 RepID=A0A3N4MAD4_9BACT|nr:pentapeptide repeat-containing protein [Chitinophaga barathri]RPD40521.1 helix-turn-helix domain-containing protein [Chitinophaga barathri]